MTRHAVTAVLLLTLVAAGCSQSPAPTEPPSPSSTPTDETAAQPAPTSGDDEGASPTRAQLDWFLALLTDPAITPETYDERFADDFRAQVPYADFLALTQEANGAAPFTLQDVEDDGLGLVATVSAGDGTSIVVNISTDTDGRINGLLIQPAEPPALDDPPATIEEAFQRLDAIGTANAVAARIEQGADQPECVTIHGQNQGEPAAIGSVFKLYVLGAVADAIESGEMAWDDTLTLTAEDKSLPSGTLQNQPDGTEVTVLEAAEGMIGISDNTATDLLIRAVGRQAVETAQARWGHANPALNTPFFTTRELFALKTAAISVQDAYLAGDTATRRQILDDLAAVPVSDIDVAAFSGDPIRPDELEWFASPLDLCRALALLLDAAERPGLGPIADILTANPGTPADPGRWALIAFKGGSEPGLLTLAWAVTDAEGNRFALTGSVLDPGDAFDPGDAVLLLIAARDLLGT